MDEESNGELAFLDALLKRNNREIYVLVYRKPKDTDQYLHYKQVARKLLLSPSLIEHIPLSQTKMPYTKKTLE